MATNGKSLAELLEVLKGPRGPEYVAAYLRVYAHHARQASDGSVVLRHDSADLDEIADWLDEVAASRKA